MKIALAQLNPTVGDITGNSDRIREQLERASDRGAELVVFPELCIIGYPPKDLLLKPAVVEECVEAVEALADACRGIAAIIGYPCPADTAQGRTLYNAAALCADGRILHRHVKSLLPTYDVFDETRYFEPGPRVDVTPFHGMRLGVSICEDLWNEREVFSRQLYHDNPIDELAAHGAQLFINAAASPFVVRKQEFRLKLMRHVARRHRLPLLYCNQVGGNDELIFDGNSCAFNAYGELVAHARAFEPDLIVVDSTELTDASAPAGGGASDRARRALPTSMTPPAEAYHALVLGLRDYCRKCGFQSVVLGLSGGIDSAVTAAICVAALGPQHVRGVAMPSRYSSPGSVRDAEQLAKRLDVRFDVIPIEPVHRAMEQILAPVFAGLEPDVTEENIQARLRGNILMAMSNKFGSMLVTTGNKSEMAVGYCTLYGDMAGGLAVLSDVPKTMVYELARWLNDSPDSPLRRIDLGPVIPESTIRKPPSAELREDQTDQDSLPPYEVLDQIIERYVEREQSAQRIIDETGFEAETVLRVVRLIDRNEYKRKQMPPGLKITSRAFGFGRRMPIAQRYDGTRTLRVRA